MLILRLGIADIQYLISCAQLLPHGLFFIVNTTLHETTLCKRESILGHVDSTLSRRIANSTTDKLQLCARLGDITSS